MNAETKQHLVMVITSKESGLENRGARENERVGKGLNELCFIPEVSWIRPAQAYLLTDGQTDGHKGTPEALLKSVGNLFVAKNLAFDSGIFVAE